jgi:hypothetical protein
MSWNTIGISEVLDELSPQEAAAFNSVQGASATQANILTRVVNMARGCLKAGGNQLDAAGTVPDQLRNEVIDVTLWRWLKKFPALKNLQTKERQDAADAARSTFREVALGRMRIELPAEPDPVPAPVNAIRVVHQERRTFTRRHLGGL